MRRISFILIHVFVIAISQDVFASSDGDNNFGYILPEYEAESSIATTHEDKELPKPTATVQSRGECFCTYDYENSFVRARVGNRLLKTGDRIMQGETASFECRYVSTVLTWENGLRFFGRANMTCGRCERWDKSILPTCKQAVETEAVLGYEEDLAVLPDGTVELQKGQSYQFFCSNVWKQPEWIYRAQDGVSVRKSDHNGDIYVSYLDITRVKDDHSGIYECFSRRPGGLQTLPTFLHIKVVEKSEMNGTSAAIFSRNGVSPRENTTPNPLENPDMKNNRTCVCVYNHDESEVIAKVGEKMLKRGDSIMLGETVSFKCNTRHYMLSWENDLRFLGKAQMTCSICQVWSDRDIPTCHRLSRRSAYITSDNDVTFLPGGILYMRKGESRIFGCHTNVFPSQWRYETKENLTEWSTGHPNSHASFLRINYAKDGHKGLYECIFQTSEKVSLQLEVGDSVRCPRHLITPGLRVHYFGDLSVGSRSTFSCSSSMRMSGSIASVCQGDGTWSDAAPKCEVKNDSVRCPRHPVTPRLRVHYSGDLSVGSRAIFRCLSLSRREMTVLTCQDDGTWSDAAPKCEDSYCSLENLLAFLPDGMVLDMADGVEEFTPGSEVQLKCENSVIDGKSKVMCGEHGRWKLGNLRCVPGCFLNLEASSKLHVDPVQDSYRLGEIIFLSCPRNYRLSSSTERLICLSGSWSDDFPECIQLEENHKFLK